jgi:predicted metallo-beta-lactamase superfamily hydrolase
MSKDTYLFQTIHERSSGPSHVTVNENRAPTDDSIRIYQEMLEKAEKNITKLFKVDNNNLKCTIAMNMYDSETYTQNLIAVMELNGVRKTAKQEILSTEQETLNALMEEMAKVIAYEMLVPALDEWTKYGIKI